MRNYRIIRKLGSGAMAHVYEGRGEVAGALTMPVAIKVLRPERVDDQKSRERFLREATTAMRLAHPNLVNVRDCGDGPDGGMFQVMELVDGVTVRDLDVAGPRRDAVVRRIARDLVRAVAYLHGEEVLHRDISPRNVLVSRTGKVKLTDLGLARVGDGSHTGRFHGTPGYVGPEVVEGRPATPASDLFSVGAVLYRLVTGHTPHASDEGEDSANAAEKRLALPDDVAEDLAEMLRGLLCRSPAERPSAEEILRRLDDGVELASDAELGALVSGCAPASADSSSGLTDSSADTHLSLRAAALLFAPGAEGAESSGQDADAGSAERPAPRGWPVRMALGSIAAVAVLALLLGAYAAWSVHGVSPSTPKPVPVAEQVAKRPAEIVPATESPEAIEVEVPPETVQAHAGERSSRRARWKSRRFQLGN